MATSKAKSTEPERVLGVGAAGDINNPEHVPTLAEQQAEVAEAAAAEAKESAKKAKEESGG